VDRFNRIFLLHGLLGQARRPVPRRRIEEHLECSRATVKRCIEDLRDYLGAPIVYDRQANGYRYDQTGEHPYELPGLWFSAAELYALLVSQRLLAEAQPGLLESHLAPLRQRIEAILAGEHLRRADLARRVRILSIGRRTAPARHFSVVADALMERRRLHLGYHARASDEQTERTVSPQRLVHYRDNWYLDAWCHLREGLRSFALDRIRSASRLAEAALELSDEQLDGYFAGAYGIFGGAPTATAVLRFTAERARWVAEEQWHPRQEARWLEDGRYELSLPYGDPRELLMDILKYGPDVEVVAPAALRETVAQRLTAAARLYP
jgi:predicted DNA-binding transcriptional regulator YafY